MIKEDINLIHKAIIFATQKHAGQMRKGTDIPYITHPMEVMQILSADGYSETIIVAGILHDTLEDTDATKDEILNLFGQDILNIIVAESEDKSKTWKERKQATIDQLEDAHLDIKAVCMADKLANLRSMNADKSVIGDKLWERFNALKTDIEWYYRQVFVMMSDLKSTKMKNEYQSLLEEVFKE